MHAQSTGSLVTQAAATSLALWAGVLVASPPQSIETELGRKLFFDTRFSADGTISCAGCHVQDRAFADGRKVAVGLGGQQGTRNAPSLIGLDVYSSFFWDGRAGSLEEQALLPVLNPIEHGLKSGDEVLAILRKDSDYAAQFQAAFGVDKAAITTAHFARAVAAYERTLAAPPSPFDRYDPQKHPAAMSDNAIRGLNVFRGSAGCASCHRIGPSGALFTDNRFHAGVTQAYELSEDLANLTLRLAKMDLRARDGLIAREAEVAALGRFVLTLDPKDIGLFRTPTLRNVALTPPYMHDGSIATLEEAVDWELYTRGEQGGRAIVLMPEEKGWLVEFLRALTSEGLGVPTAGS